MCLHPGKPTVPWAALGEGWPEERGRGLILLLNLCGTPFGILCPGLGALVQEGCGAGGVDPEEDHKDSKRAGAPL